MNNDQFRRLVSASSSSKKTSKDGSNAPASSRPAAPVSLGSRSKASIHMTPRAVVGSAHSTFAQQLAGRNQSKNPHPQDQKGRKKAKGYVDLSKSRVSADEDERTARLKVLEESLKNDEITEEEFDKQRAAIAGGDLSSTHLVKGLDFKLLERVRKGEDVSNPEEKEPEAETNDAEPEDEAPEEDFDEAFERLEKQEVTAIQKEKPVKKGQMAPLSLVLGKKRTRDQILADMKAARAAAAEAAKAKEAEGALGGRFKKIGAVKKAGTRIERDHKGREVLVIVDEDGHERRKVRKVLPGDEEAREMERLALMPDKDVKPLGMEVPEAYRDKTAKPESEEDDDDIFQDAGDDYDPLAEMDEVSDSDSEEEGVAREKKDKVESKDDGKGAMLPPPPKPAGPRNYFAGSKTTLASEEVGPAAPSLSDPSIIAALRKAGALERAAAPAAENDTSEEAMAVRAKKERHRKMLEADTRDAEDLDMGFGTSRFEDEEDIEAEENGLKLSEWGAEGYEDYGDGRKGPKKRKRGPKKRKGDGNNSDDVMKIVEKRRAEKDN